MCRYVGERVNAHVGRYAGGGVRVRMCVRVGVWAKGKQTTWENHRRRPQPVHGVDDHGMDTWNGHNLVRKWKPEWKRRPKVEAKRQGYVEVYGEVCR